MNFVHNQLSASTCPGCRHLPVQAARFHAVPASESLASETPIAWLADWMQLNLTHLAWSDFVLLLRRRPSVRAATRKASSLPAAISLPTLAPSAPKEGRLSHYEDFPLACARN